MGIVLFKFGWRQHMQELVEGGRLRMSRLGAYPEHRSRVIGDPNDGLLARYSAENPTLKVTFKIGDDEIEVPGTSITLKDRARKHAVLCMCGLPLISEGDGVDLRAMLAPVLYDPRMREFGDTLVIFRDTVEFVRRLEAAAAKAGHELDHGPVEYVASDYCGDMGPFRKLDSYKYQSEWRCITLDPIDDEFLWLDIGPTLDIAHWVDLTTIPTVGSSAEEAPVARDVSATQTGEMIEVPFTFGELESRVVEQDE